MKDQKFYNGIPAEKDSAPKKQNSEPLSYREKMEAKRDEMLNTMLDFIQNNSAEWERGWFQSSLDIPANGVTEKPYRGLNMLYLMVVSSMKGYTDNRWVTFNQAQDLGAHVKRGEKAREIFYWSQYDKLTKKPFDEKTVEGMTQEEKATYLEENVRPVLKFYQVFNAEQCDNFPERKKEELTPEMSEEERARQNTMIEQVIKNSAAPITYGGSRAYYSPSLDEIHLPKIGDFKSMQDYYATALHEIAHSTGHKSRLNRNLEGIFGKEEYAKEELRAELASVFMQTELGITIDGHHFENHGAYLSSWLSAVRKDTKEFFAAARDAEKISDYVAEHYLQSERAEEKAQDKNQSNKNDATPVFERNVPFAEQVDKVLSGADTTNSHLEVLSTTPQILQDVGIPNLPILMTAKHLKTITQDEGDGGENYHGLEAETVKQLPGLLAEPVMIMDSLTRDDSIVVVTKSIDKENRPVIGAIKLNGFGRRNNQVIDANILTSAYGKDNFQAFIERNIEQGNVLYYSKEKSQALSVNPGVQFPDVMATLDSDIIIRKARAFVNTSAEKNQENSSNNVERREFEASEHKQRKWLDIDIPAELLCAEGESKSRMIKLPQGEYSHFVLFVPKAWLKPGAQEGSMKLSVDANSEYVIRNDGREVRLSGSELRAAFEGKEVGKRAQRVAPSRRTVQAMDALDANVPDEMKALPNWCVFRTTWNEEKGKKDKSIISPVDGKWGKSNDPSTWTDFGTAKKYALEHGAEGLAFALDESSGICCIDLDKCIDKDGNLTDSAKKLTSEHEGTYIETSTSGNGIHIFVKDDLLAKGKYRNRVEVADGEIEVYESGRFISMTGNVRTNVRTLGQTPQTTKAWLRRTLGERAPQQSYVPTGKVEGSDEEIIKRIENSAKGPDFSALMAGEDLCNDHSRSDYRLLNMLAFFTDSNQEQMARIFRTSGLYRPDKGDSYLQRSITAACSGLKTRYGQGQGGAFRNSSKGPSNGKGR